MSIEKLIADNTAALKALTDALSAHKNFTPAEKLEDSKIHADVAPAIVTKEKPESTEPEVSPTWEDVVKAFRTRITEKGRDSGVELLTKFGVKGKLTQDQLPEYKYKEFINACN